MQGTVPACKKHLQNGAKTGPMGAEVSQEFLCANLSVLF